MILVIVFFILSIGALTTFLVPPQRRAARIGISLLPAAALAVLLLRLPLPDSFSISWSPSSLFSEPILFRASSPAVVFAVYFSCLLILIEWTRPMRQSPGRASRIAVYLLIIAGITASFASNPLAVIIIWALIDFLSFLTVFFLKSPVEIGAEGVSSSLTHSLGILAGNMLGNGLVLFSLFAGPPGAPADWGILWSSAPLSLAPILFLAGILFRILISPIQFTFSRIPTTSTGAEILLRIVSPAAALCLLAKIWPPQIPLPGTNVGFAWAILPLALFILVGAWQWCLSSSAYSRRGNFLLILPSFALLSAIVSPNTEGIFLAAGGMFILGGGILLVYLGFLSHRRWMAAFLLLLGILFSGPPFSPISVWSTSVYPGLLSGSGVPVLILLALSHVFLLGAIFRSALEPVEEFPSNEPLFLFIFSLGTGICLSFLFYPGWTGPLSATSIVISVLLLLFGVLLVLLVRRFQRTGTSLFLFLEKVIRLEWLERAFNFTFQKTAVFVSGVESFLSGEGAMLWSLGIALLLYLVFRGG